MIEHRDAYLWRDTPLDYELEEAMKKYEWDEKPPPDPGFWKGVWFAFLITSPLWTIAIALLWLLWLQ